MEAAADLVPNGLIRQTPVKTIDPTILEIDGPRFQNTNGTGPFDRSNIFPSESTRTEGIMGNPSLNQPQTYMQFPPGFPAQGYAGGGATTQFESGANGSETINGTTARGGPRSHAPMRLSDSNLLQRRRLQQEVDTLREQLRQVERERDHLRTQLQWLTADDPLDENVQNAFPAHFRSSERNNPSSNWLDHDDPARGAPTYRGPDRFYQGGSRRFFCSEGVLLLQKRGC
ncbi:MAG: hypothetical protein HETSPECPRED_004959 [Heterodermia speciosa]|uniref:Uncharacterized protein n=1 Tax=Heterodermia speciosa TaxID=116794 RepID=A0A8H3I6P9_9LECA|nr:MAG: hypothetical protein HETSPECPRED_004959 [Heterodermia speciosa]